MKKIVIAVLLLFGLIVSSVPAEARPEKRYVFTVSGDSANFTTNVNKFWRWLYTMVHLGGGSTVFQVYHTVIDETSSSYNTIVSQVTTDTATVDTTVYPGWTTTGSPQMPGEVHLTDSQELKVQVSGIGSRPAFVTVVGEED